MTPEPAHVRETISTFLQRNGKGTDSLDDATSLWGDGLELDSLDAAELSAVLEDSYGRDPFSVGDAMPDTVGDVVGFYAADAG
ncbi:hypothetical protein [Nocardioides sp. SYSU D00038]|uniref:hypothetical protein n=1 Tax=Nocardioides sp. SYSU D00038 TaxID=2812554 RepID=UPI00196724AB|nr:hypothetical protein [Nocardioides sp. SYSU D00038]